MRWLVIGSGLAAALCACDKKPSPVANEAVISQKIETASDAIRAVEKAGIKVVDTHVVTEADDANHLLGRPGQYTSKVTFFDGRHPKAGDDLDEGQNTIEVFATAEDARRRYDYIDGLTKSMPMLMQYQVLKGRLLARFDKVLLPSEVKQYDAVLPTLD